MSPALLFIDVGAIICSVVRAVREKPTAAVVAGIAVVIVAVVAMMMIVVVNMAVTMFKTAITSIVVVVAIFIFIISWEITSMNIIGNGTLCSFVVS